VRRSAAFLVMVVLTLAACGGGKSRSFDRYYDPQALFATDLPRGNDVTVATPQEPSPDGPVILGGVVSAPPQPSADAGSVGFIGGNLSQQTTTDQTVYEMFAVTTDSFIDVRDMVLTFLTSDPNVDVREDQAVQIDGAAGRLVVADVDGGQAQSSLAAAFTLGEDGTGFIVVALFPPGEWDAERLDFFKVLASFKREAPPGIPAAPLAGGSG